MYNKIRNWFANNYKTIIRLSYLVPILFVAFVSISHVITWYAMTNPITWAIYLSVGIEIAALSALAGLAVKNNKSIYLPFMIVTLIQLIGNMFFVFQYIDTTTKLFKDWMILVDPLFSMLGMLTSGNVDGHRRWLAAFAGALLPIISLSFLHLLVKFNDKELKSQTIDLAPDTIDLTPQPATPIVLNDEPKDIEQSKTPTCVVETPYPQERIDGYDSERQIFEAPVDEKLPKESIESAIEFTKKINDEDLFIPVKADESVNSDIIIEPVIEEPEITGNADTINNIVNDVVSDVVIEEPEITGNNENVNDGIEPQILQAKQQPVNNNQIIRVGPHNEKKTIFFRGK